MTKIVNNNLGISQGNGKVPDGALKEPVIFGSTADRTDSIAHKLFFGFMNSVRSFFSNVFHGRNPFKEQTSECPFARLDRQVVESSTQTDVAVDQQKKFKLTHQFKERLEKLGIQSQYLSFFPEDAITLSETNWPKQYCRTKEELAEEIAKEMCAKMQSSDSRVGYLQPPLNASKDERDLIATVNAKLVYLVVSRGLVK